MQGLQSISKRHLSFLLISSIVLVHNSIDCRPTCQFPEEYRGDWFQERLGKMNITLHNINKKGRCHRSWDNKFILFDESHQCYRCLVITKRHENVLQYKESYCFPQNPKNGKLCREIRGNAILHTLIREPAKPIPCIFDGSYIFSYSNGSEICKNPYSNLDECASETDYKFHFKKCRSIPQTHDLNYDFKCLAQWDGGGKYFVGVFQDPNRYGNMYRCFLYENSQLGRIKLAMSADASCMGLVNIHDGPMSMELTKNIEQYPTSICTFPPWLTENHSRWHDLSARYAYHIDRNKNTIRIWFKSDQKKPRIAIDVLRCYKLDRITTTRRLFQAISFTTSGCISKYQCVRFLKRHDDVVEINRGKMVRTQETACYEENFSKNNDKQLLIPSRLSGTQCPFDGRYDVEITASNSPACRSTLTSGCGDANNLRLELSACPETLSAASLTCLSTWSQNTTTYVIARRTSGSKAANCFSFKTDSGRNLHFAIDSACNMDVPPIIDKHLSYTLRRSKGPCVSGKNEREGIGKNIIGHQSAGKITADNSGQISTVSQSIFCCSALLLIFASVT